MWAKLHWNGELMYVQTEAVTAIYAGRPCEDADMANNRSKVTTLLLGAEYLTVDESVETALTIVRGEG